MMDPLTHAAIGAGIYAISGGEISLSNPYFVGCVAGAMVPDLDIAARFWNDYLYLRYHRGGSHSFIGMLPISLAIAFLTGSLLPGGSFLHIFIWSYLGCLSHTIFDIFNSYGAQLLWPLSRKKYSLSVLKIFDYFIILFFAAMLVYRNSSWSYKGAILLLFVIYLILLLSMRWLAKDRVSKFFKGRVDRNSVKILPSSRGFFSWDFIIASKKHVTVGKIDILRTEVDIIERMRKVEAGHREKLLEDRVAKFFREFTPFFHVEIREQSRRVEVVYTDLRYRVKNRFKHHATAVYNAKGVLEECIFHPFRKDNNIRF